MRAVYAWDGLCSFIQRLWAVMVGAMVVSVCIHARCVGIVGAGLLVCTLLGAFRGDLVGRCIVKLV